MRTRLRQAITVGLSLAGCTGRAVPDGPAEAGDGEGTSAGDGTTGASASAGTSPTSTSTSTSATTVDPDSGEAELDEGNDEEVPEPDFGSIPDVGEPLGCDAPPPPVAQCAVGPTESDTQWVTTCIAPSAGGECPSPESGEVSFALDDCAWMVWVGDCGGGIDGVCGPPAFVDDQCCYWAPFTGFPCPGRPFNVGGHDRIAALVERDDWRDRLPEARPDAALAEAWCFDARHEHAAIASFARFAMQLLALAAPPRFVEAAARAAIDEREHATLFFGLARAHGGPALGPGPLDVAGALEGADDPVHVVTATVREGCIAETISALQLQRALETAEDPELRVALARVLEQELRHVELAWSFVAWAYARGDEHLRAAVMVAFADAERCIPRGPDVDPAPSDASAWRASGRLTRADALAVALQTIRNVVLPAADELFARASEPAVELGSGDEQRARHRG